MEFDIAKSPPANYGIFHIFFNFFKMKASLMAISELLFGIPEQEILQILKERETYPCSRQETGQID